MATRYALCFPKPLNLRLDEIQVPPKLNSATKSRSTLNRLDSSFHHFISFYTLHPPTISSLSGLTGQKSAGGEVLEGLTSD